MMNCPYCGKLTDPKLDNCPHCGGYMRRSAGSAAASSSQRQTCPNCHALVQDGDLICVNCGTNLLTGQKISDEKRVVARRQNRRPMWVWITAILVVLALVLFVWAWMATRREPVAYARELIANNRAIEAQHVLTEHLERHPEDATAQYELGKLYWQTGDYQPAAEAFRAAAKGDSSNRHAFLLAAISYDLINDNGRVAETLESLVTAHPDYAEGWLLLGLVRGLNGNRDGQTQALQRAAQLAPNDSAGLTYLGIARALQGRYAQANQDLDKALKTQPQNNDAKAAKAFLAGLQGQSGAAATLLQEAAKGNTSIRGLALTQLGVTLLSQGDFAGALQNLNAAQSAEGAGDVARYYYALALLAQGRQGDALPMLEQLGTGSGPYAADALVLAAQAYLARNDINKARDSLNRAESMGAQGALYFTTKGRMHAAAGEDNPAREAFKRAIQEDSSYPAAWLEYGLFHISREQSFTEGINKLERYLQLLTPDERENARAIVDLVQQLKQTTGNTSTAGSIAATSGIMS